MNLKNVLILALALLLLALPFAQLHAEHAARMPELTPAPETQFTPMEAVVNSSLAGASNLTHKADDYDTPQATYFNGTRLTILAIEETLGDYPAQLEDPRQLWAKVRIGQGAQFEGIIGMMPLINLAPASSTSLPEGQLAQDAPLYLDNGHSEQTLGSYKAGTPLRLLGWLQDWAHVEMEDQAGFLRHDAISLDERNQQLVSSALPATFDHVQPGFQQNFEAYMEDLMKLYDKHGDVNHWPLEVAAQASELAKAYKVEVDEVINILPEATDLSKEEVTRLAKEAANERFKLDENAWSSVSLAFFYERGKPESTQWKASLWGKEGTPDVKIWLDRQGKILQTMSAALPSGSNAGEASTQPAPEDRSSLEYYILGRPALPIADEMTQERAKELALDEFVKQTQAAADKTLYTLQASLMTNDQEDLRWWLVSIEQLLAPGVPLVYQVALVLPAGTPAITTTLAHYQDSQKWGQRMVEFVRKEAELGPFALWSLEEKAAWEPDFYGLPGPDDISLDQAHALAKAQVMADYGLSEKDLEAYMPSFSFIIYTTPCWQVSFLPGQAAQNAENQEYSYFLDAKTGELLSNFTGNPGDVN